MTWSEPALVTTDLPLQRDEFTLNMPTGPHDRLVQTSSGRVLFPIHFPWIPGEKHTAPSTPRVICSVLYYCYPTVLLEGNRLHMTYYGPVGGQQFNLTCRPLLATWFTD